MVDPERSVASLNVRRYVVVIYSDTNDRFSCPPFGLFLLGALLAMANKLIRNTESVRVENENEGSFSPFSLSKK